MREIKFRAWDKKYSLMERGLFGLRSDGLTSSNSGPENVILMQYTGLKDKSGKEIYEGDIVKGPTYSTVCGPGYKSTRTKEIVFQVKSHIGCYGYAFTISGKYDNNYRGFPRPEELEVIGNVWENPELLEAK